MSILTTGRNDMQGPIPISTKQPERGDPEKLRADTEAFLANGGEITKVGWGATGMDTKGRLGRNIVIAPRGK